MRASIIVTTHEGKPVSHICEIEGYNVKDPNSEKELRILERIFARHSEQISKELAEEFREQPSWKPKEFRTGLINPSTGKEWVLSDYYVDDSGNRHFTHEEAMEIWRSVPGWRPCTDEFHKALAETVFDADKWEWRENVLGSGLNGFEYMTKRLGYELGGFRDTEDGTLYAVGNSGCSWSSTVSGSNVRFLGFSPTWLSPQSSNYRAYGLQLRCLKEK